MTAITDEASGGADRAAPRARFTFRFKLLGAIGLVALADTLFYLQRVGSTLGLFGLALLVLLFCLRPELHRDKGSRVALTVAAAMVLVLADDPSLLAASLCWIALTMAVLLPRTAQFDDGWRWAGRLAFQSLAMPILPFIDRRRVKAAKRRRGARSVIVRWSMLALPVAGSLVFLSLFAVANPLIGNAFSRIDIGLLIGGFSILRFFFWLITLMLVWSLLRPARTLLAPAAPGADPDLPLPGVSVGSVTLSLFAFNLIFALQNALDVAFLWSGAPLPEGVTLAEYAHRGAYPLIATALLAGLFVLVTLRPGSETARSATVRKLVYVWIAQNLLLVASTILRTLDYIDAYSLTRLRIAALIWMGLVALGLALICYRIWKSKSGGWLINANLLAVALVLGLCATVDLSRMAAAWNVRHAGDAGGRGARLDLCYLHGLGPSALLPLVELESRPISPALRERASWLRNRIMDRLETRQQDWHGWTFRNARRLAAARKQVAERRLPRFTAHRRPCTGVVPPPPPPRIDVVPPPPPVLTARPPR